MENKNASLQEIFEEITERRDELKILYPNLSINNHFDLIKTLARNLDSLRSEFLGGKPLILQQIGALVVMVLEEIQTAEKGKARPEPPTIGKIKEATKESSKSDSLLENLATNDKKNICDTCTKKATCVPYQREQAEKAKPVLDLEQVMRGKGVQEHLGHVAVYMRKQDSREAKSSTAHLTKKDYFALLSYLQSKGFPAPEFAPNKKELSKFVLYSYKDPTIRISIVRLKEGDKFQESYVNVHNRGNILLANL